MLDNLLSNIAPHPCSGCAETGTILCTNCKNDIIDQSFDRCIVCTTPTSSSSLCRACARKSGISDAWCVSEREDALKMLLDSYKFHSAKAASIPLASLLDLTLPLLGSSLTVVPAPTAPAHRRVRGFDHTALIAKRFAKHRQLAYRSVLENTSRDIQHLSSRVKRFENAQKSIHVTGVVPESVLLIDDIYTTGATVSACVQQLALGGANNIFVAIIARQVLDELAYL